MTITHYHGKRDPDDEEGLIERAVDEFDLDVHLLYCLGCPCGKFQKSVLNRDKEIAVYGCPQVGKNDGVYYNPQTGERSFRWCAQPPNKETTCKIAAVCTCEETYPQLRELMVIPQGWTLEVEDNKDYVDYLDLDMGLRLHRIPDPGAYEQWIQDQRETKRKIS